MERNVGTVSRGIRAPIIRQGDDLSLIVIKSLLDASKSSNFTFNDKDVICITESIVARSQGNYITIEYIATDVKKKYINPFQINNFIYLKQWKEK